VEETMSLIGNIIWLIFGGLIAGLGYIIGGILLCLTIIGIPFGLQAMQLGVATLAPFGKEVVQGGRREGCLVLIFDVLWLVLFGWEIALAHLAGALILAITIIGIPFAKQHLKLVPVALLPFTYKLR
jgi:uncharacterized membrane protein YccF (DUF307 family)